MRASVVPSRRLRPLLFLSLLVILIAPTKTNAYSSSSSSSTTTRTTPSLFLSDIFQKMKSQIFYDQTGQSAPTKSISKIKIHSRDSNVFETDDVAPMTEEEVEESLAEHEDAEEEGEEGPYVVEKKRKRTERMTTGRLKKAKRKRKTAR